MADKFKLDEQGHCPTCGNLSKELEQVKCFSCNHLLHAVCLSATADEKVATKTCVFHHQQASTQRNFQFFCDKCITELEINKAESDSNRLHLLETKMSSIDSQLQEICSMLKSKNEQANDLNPVPNLSLEKSSIWSDSEQLSKVKAPPSTAVLVVPKVADHRLHTENKIIIEKAVVDNQIPLTETYTNKTGDLVLVCESVEKRDELKTLVHTVKQDIAMNSPKVKIQSITIVGMEREYNADEIKKLILQQNFLIQRFAEANNFDEHFKVHSVKPTKNNAEKFQVFASVSEILREGFKKTRDKLIIGVNSCKVYDRKHTKRCNNCQLFGHFVANCPTPNKHSCGKCSGDHSTKECDSTNRGCVNCKRNNLEHTSHSAFYHKCPTLLKYQELMEKSQKIDHLNSLRQKQITQP